MNDAVVQLVVERRIAAPVSLVFELLIDPDELRQWLGPRECVVTCFESEAHVGAAFRFRMQSPDGGWYGADGEYREIVQDERIVMTWRWNEAPPGTPLDRSETLITITLRAEGRHTVVTLTHSRLPDRASADSHTSGWNDALDKLSERVSQIQKGA